MTKPEEINLDVIDVDDPVVKKVFEQFGFKIIDINSSPLKDFYRQTEYVAPCTIIIPSINNG